MDAITNGGARMRTQPELLDEIKTRFPELSDDVAINVCLELQRTRHTVHHPWSRILISMFLYIDRLERNSPEKLAERFKASQGDLSKALTAITAENAKSQREFVEKANSQLRAEINQVIGVAIGDAKTGVKRLVDESIKDASVEFGARRATWIMIALSAALLISNSVLCFYVLPKRVDAAIATTSSTQEIQEPVADAPAERKYSTYEEWVASIPSGLCQTYLDALMRGRYGDKSAEQRANELQSTRKRDVAVCDKYLPEG